MMKKPLEQVSGSYTLKAGFLGKKAIARAFVTGAGAGTVAEASGATPEEALAELKTMLEALHTNEVAQRRFDDRLEFAVPSEPEFARALLMVKPDGPHWAMLRDHALSEDEGMTAGELARAAGYPNYNSANLQYGRLAKKVASALGIDLPRSKARPDVDVATGVLASAGEERNGEFVWVMHPELRAAVLAHAS